MSVKNSQMVFDPIYGFIHLTSIEWEIIHSFFYQRLRLIKQLGFSHYVFHGAEHSRFGHSIGVMYNAHLILKSCGIGVMDHELFTKSKKISEKAYFHQMIRLAALLHDLGTFPYSHTIEGAYIAYGKKHPKKTSKVHEDNHEHLGSFIIKNTNYVGGITRILNNYEIDAQELSYLVKGVSPNKIANQILHSDIDCDRMDYLLRDAYYTGLKYGAYDRDYLMHHFVTETIAGEEILAIRDNAIHCIADFILSRFAWYSQVIRSNRGAKFDAMALEVAKFLLEKKKMHSFEDLLGLIKDEPLEFYKFNDSYFFEKVHEAYNMNFDSSNGQIKDLAYGLLTQEGPMPLFYKEFRHILVNSKDGSELDKLRKKAFDKVGELREVLAKSGDRNTWLLQDIPKRDIFFIKSSKLVQKEMVESNVFLERDPIKVSFGNGEVMLLADLENSVVSKLQNTVNFVPNVYASPKAYNLLSKDSKFSSRTLDFL